jgi:hypothetical protein
MIPGNMVKVYSLTHKAREAAKAFGHTECVEPQIGLITKGDGSPEYGDYRQVLLSSGEKVMKSVHRLELIQ